MDAAGDTEDVTSTTDMTSQVIVPLRLDNELIGTIQLDMRAREPISGDEELVLQALTACFVTAMSRLRAATREMTLAEQILSSSRFLVAETLYGMTMHSLGHTIDRFLGYMSEQLERREVRENVFLLETLQNLNKQFGKAEEDIRAALGFARVRGVDSRLSSVATDVQETIDIWASYLRAARCVVDVQVRASDCVCWTKPAMISQIISALITNSVEAYTKKVRISISNSESVHLPCGLEVDNAVCVEFSDDGVGIPEGSGESIFDPTYSTKPATFGVGLGLFVARCLARQAGGDLYLRAATVSRRGATFVLALPVASSSNGM